MKKLLFVSLLLITQLSLAQTLSGTIKYSLKYNMNSKEKEQMEKYGVALPSSMEIASDGASAKMTMSSTAGVAMEVLHTKNESYFLSRKEKKAYKMPDNANASRGGSAKVTKTDEFETILGHKCRKYIVEKEKGKETIWATPDYKMSPTMLANMTKRGPGDSNYMKDLDGVPLKITSEERGNSFEMVAENISETKPSSSELSLPSDYTIAPFNPSVMGMMMGAGGPPKK
jgi:hypothetical protein